MTNNSWLIYNARIVNEGQCVEGDVYVQNGRIERIGDLSQLSKKVPVIDLEGRYLCPGMIDDQVHFREPGLTHKATIYSESGAAVAGGVTSFMEMPNTQPPTVNLDELERKLQIAVRGCRANYAFYLGATEDNLEVIKSLPSGLVPGVKIFMGSSTGNMLIDDKKILEQIFKHSPALIVTHCEDDKRIKDNEKRFLESFGENINFAMHPKIRDRQACFDSTVEAIGLSLKYQTPLHILHITTQEECELFEQGDVNPKMITAEACLHHTFFDDTDYAKYGSLIKCNPAIKTSKDREAIVQALSLDKIDVIATDHAPHTMKEKQNHYFNAPSGLPLLQEAMPLALELVHNKSLVLPELIKKTSHAVANRFKIQGRGYIREGYWADLVCVDMNSSYQTSMDNVLSKCAWTPFFDVQFRSAVWATWVNGELAWYQNKLQHSQGQALEFVPQR